MYIFLGGVFLIKRHFQCVGVNTSNETFYVLGMSEKPISKTLPHIVVIVVIIHSDADN